MQHIDMNIKMFKMCWLYAKHHEKKLVANIAILSDILRGEVWMFSLKLVFG